MKAYKIVYMPENETPTEAVFFTDIVTEKHLIEHVNRMWSEGRLNDESIELFLEKHPHKVQTKSDALELLKLDGWTFWDFELEV